MFSRNASSRIAPNAKKKKLEDEVVEEEEIDVVKIPWSAVLSLSAVVLFVVIFFSAICTVTQVCTDAFYATNGTFSIFSKTISSVGSYIVFCVAFFLAGFLTATLQWHAYPAISPLMYRSTAIPLNHALPKKRFKRTAAPICFAFWYAICFMGLWMVTVNGLTSNAFFVLFDGLGYAIGYFLYAWNATERIPDS